LYHDTVSKVHHPYPQTVDISGFNLSIEINTFVSAVKAEHLLIAGVLIRYEEKMGMIVGLQIRHSIDSSFFALRFWKPGGFLFC
jgi:hypothetical protein